MLITVRKRSLRRLCVHRCLSVHRGGGVSVSVQGGLCPQGVFVQGSLCLRGLCPGGVCVQRVSVRGVSIGGGLCPGGLCLGVSVQWGLCPGVQGGLCPGGVCHGEPHRMVMGGRNASYWNAFLFLQGNLDMACNKICCILSKKIQFFSVSDLILDLCEQYKQKIKINLGLDLLFHGNTNSDTGNFATGCILKLELQLKTNEFVWP